jgi:F-type H+-transporting ATPase subunit b
MEILNQFGFDIKLFAAQVVNFLVIAYVFKRFLYKPILETINKRNTTIKKGLADAENSAKALADAQLQSDALLKKAGKEAERILSEAKLQSQTTKEEMMAETKKELEKMMNETKKQIQLERDNFKNEAKNISLEISKKVLEAAIANLFNKDEQESLIKRGVQKLKYDKSTKN